MIEIDVDTHGIEERVQDAIDDGVADAADEFEDELQDKAEKKVIDENAIWRGDLLESFRSYQTKVDDETVIKLLNTSDHAAPVEEGAEYTNKRPPVDALLPWVRSELSAWTVIRNNLQRAGSLTKMRNLQTHPEFPGYTYDEVDKAFWLQEKIFREGLDAVRFMAVARAWAQQEGDSVVANAITKSLKRSGL